jgi:hypothetical protein
MVSSVRTLQMAAMRVDWELRFVTRGLGKRGVHLAAWAFSLGLLQVAAVSCSSGEKQETSRTTRPEMPTEPVQDESPDDESTTTGGSDQGDDWWGAVSTDCALFVDLQQAAVDEHAAFVAATEGHRVDDGPPRDVPRMECVECLDASNTQCAAPHGNDCLSSWYCVERHCSCETCLDELAAGTAFCECVESCMPAGPSECRDGWESYVPCVTELCETECK